MMNTVMEVEEASRIVVLDLSGDGELLQVGVIPAEKILPVVGSMSCPANYTHVARIKSPRYDWSWGGEKQDAWITTYPLAPTLKSSNATSSEAIAAAKNALWLEREAQ